MYPSLPRRLQKRVFTLRPRLSEVFGEVPADDLRVLGAIVVTEG